MPHIMIDADACPVKDEVYHVAARHGVAVTVVTNSPLRVPRDPNITLQVVGEGFDAADDWIAEHADADSVVITADILLAERCVKAGARVLSSAGKPFTPENIGAAVATRAIMNDLRAGVAPMGSRNASGAAAGPPPFSKADRSRFLAALHETLVQMTRD